MQVDDSVVFKLLTQRSFIFGNMKTNSDLFIGGVPRVSILIICVHFAQNKNHANRKPESRNINLGGAQTL